MYCIHHFIQWIRNCFHQKEKMLKDFYEGSSKDSPSNNTIERNNTIVCTDTSTWPARVSTDFYDPWMSVLTVSVWIAVVTSWFYLFSWFRYVNG